MNTGEYMKKSEQTLNSTTDLIIKLKVSQLEKLGFY